MVKKGRGFERGLCHYQENEKGEADLIRLPPGEVLRRHIR